MPRSNEEIQNDLDELFQAAKEPSYWEEEGIAYASYVLRHAELSKELRQNQPVLP